MPQTRILKFWFPVAFYSGIIFLLSSWPSVTAPWSWPYFDKILHFLEYMPFGLLSARAFLNTSPRISRKTIWGLVVLCSFLYGLSDEWHQSFVAGRQAALADAFTDAIGGFCGALIYCFFSKYSA